MGLPRSLRIAFVIGAIALGVYTFTRPAGVFSGDEGIKLVQTMSLGEGQVSLSYPGAELDPKRDIFPYRVPFAIADGTDRYGVYSITFTAPSLIGWKLLGWWGLFLLPLAGGLLALWYTLALGWRVFGDERWALACGAVLMTTPVALNASLFNEHAISTGLMLMAVARISLPRPGRAWLIGSGVAIGLAVTMRHELAAAVPALAAFTALVAERGEVTAGSRVVAFVRSRREAIRRLAWIAVGGSLPVAAYAAVNLSTIGLASPMLHPDYAGQQADRYRDAVEPDFLAITGVPSGILYIPLALGLLAFRNRRLEVARRLAVVAVIGVWCYVVVVYLQKMTMPALLPGTLFIATPLFALGLATGPYADRGPEPRLAGALWCLAVAGTLSVLVFYPVGGGLRLGARYLLPMMPLLVIVSLAAARRSRLFLAAAVATTLLGLAPQYFNHQLAMETRSRNAAIVEDLEALPQRYVFSESFWGKQVIAPLYQDKVILSLPSPRHKYLQAIRAQGEREVIEVLGGLQKTWWLVRPRPEQTSTSGKVKVYRFIQ